tara:strand:- start:1839 stop:2417 length:579 start_codon:yes stop_codon:yes gene_type:complete
MDKKDVSILNMLLEHWSQVVLLIGALGFLLKQFTSYRFKIRELKYGMSHKGKMESITKFFSAYSDCKQIWNGLPINQIIKNEIPATEIDRMILPRLRNLDAIIIELGLYFKSKELEKFSKLYENMLQMNSLLMALWSNNELQSEVTSGINLFHMTTIQKVNLFTSKWESISKENHLHIKELQEQLKKNLGIK